MKPKPKTCEKKGPCDKFGKPWALAKYVREGDTLKTDGGFTCTAEGVRKKVRRDLAAGRGIAGLYICCRDGKHFLSGQLGYRRGETGALIGLYPHKKAA